MLIELNDKGTVKTIDTLRVAAIEIMNTAKNKTLANTNFKNFEAECLLQTARELLFLRRTVRTAFNEQILKEKE